MQTVHEAGATWVALSEDDQELVREQMNRLLETHHFKNSRRYPALLRFIVEETLAGRGEFLKERLLGVRVFDRPADYDTATDPIVRVTIAEIRKRIAQYYHDEEHDAEIRIELLPGRYAPEFRSRREAVLSANGHHAAESAETLPIAEPQPVSAPPAVATQTLPSRRPRMRLRDRWLLAGVATAIILGSLAIPVTQWWRPAALEQFWTPFLASQQSILFCLPTDVGKTPGPAGVSDAVLTSSPVVRTLKPGSSAGTTFLDYESLGENVVYSDMLATLRITNVLALHHRDYRVRLTTSTNLGDLRLGPTVLIGALDNQWTMRALEPLRFHFAGSDADRYWIADAHEPDNHSRSLDLKQQYNAVTRDYAIVARLHNEQTGQPEIIVAGIGMSGTAAAGEFVGDEQHMRELRQRIGSGFATKDFEVVLSTDVVNGVAGSPKILEVSVW